MQMNFPPQLVALTLTATHKTQTGAPAEIVELGEIEVPVTVGGEGANLTLSIDGDGFMRAMAAKLRKAADEIDAEFPASSDAVRPPATEQTARLSVNLNLETADALRAIADEVGGESEAMRRAIGLMKHLADVQRGGGTVEVVGDDGRSRLDVLGGVA
jgi:hypothetical protein